MSLFLREDKLMGSSIGTTLKVTVFGQSHSAAIGCVIEGIPAGFELDEEQLSRFLARRAPGQGPWSTTRKEPDRPRIVSGLNQAGKTCGAPLAALIENTNTRSQDYANLARIPRPGHADWPAQIKWEGNQDVAGGGHFSGRLTAPLCIAGGIALQILATKGIHIAAHILQIEHVRDVPFAAVEKEDLAAKTLQLQIDELANNKAFPTIDDAAGIAMRDAIEAARTDRDSVGGIIECVATGVPAGIGGPMFDGIESVIARLVFGVPAVKGLEFGCGFAAAGMRGSQHNDPYRMKDGKICPQSNHAGGNLGGITTAAPILFRMAVKPTSSIGKEQCSVDMIDKVDTKLVVKGRHDPCVVPRAVPVAESVMALAVLDAWLSWPPDGTLSRLQ